MPEEMAKPLRRYLEGLFHHPVDVLDVAPLGGAARDDVKAFGYGVPLNIRCRVGTETREVVLARTCPVSGFGHDYPADRAWQALHPWNILFREGTDFSVLDRSRGEWGEPAADVAALAINYLFFGLRRAAREGQAGTVAEPFRALLRAFLAAYGDASGDSDIEEVLPPFLAFRAFVLAHPSWYPTLDTVTRATIIRLGRAMLDGESFALEAVPTHSGAAA